MIEELNTFSPEKTLRSLYSLVDHLNFQFPNLDLQFNRLQNNSVVRIISSDTSEVLLEIDLQKEDSAFGLNRQAQLDIQEKLGIFNA